MNTDELKKMLKNSTAVLILDNGEPSFVILGYDSYKNLLSDQGNQEKEIKINHQNTSAFLQKNGKPDGSNQQGGDYQNFRYKISEKETELLEKINKEILALKSEIEKEEETANNPHVD